MKEFRKAKNAGLDSDVLICVLTYMKNAARIDVNTRGFSHITIFMAILPSIDFLTGQWQDMHAYRSRDGLPYGFHHDRHAGYLHDGSPARQYLVAHRVG